MSSKHRSATSTTSTTTHVSSRGGKGGDLIPKLAELRGKLQEQLVERDKLQARADKEKALFDKRKDKARKEHAEAGVEFVESEWAEGETAPYTVPEEFLQDFHALHYEVASVEQELTALGFGTSVPAAPPAGGTALEAEE